MIGEERRLAKPTTESALKRLSGLHPLPEAEAALVSAQCQNRVRVDSGQDLVDQGNAHAFFLLEGWAAYQTQLGDGRRQILRLLLPGDTFGEYPHLAPPFCNIVALTQVSVADASPVLQAASSGQAPALARALAVGARQHDTLMVSAVTRLGAMSAYERLVHLLLEVAERLVVVGLSDGQRFPLPLTQEMLAEVLGLSIVHVNRTLQQLRRERLIELRSGVAVLLQPDMLADIASCGVRTRSLRSQKPALALSGEMA